MGTKLGTKTKNRLSEIFGKPYLMVYRAIILQLGKQKLVYKYRKKKILNSIQSLLNKESLEIFRC